MTSDTDEQRKMTPRDIPAAVKRLYVMSYSEHGVLGILIAVFLTPIAIAIAPLFLSDPCDDPHDDQEKVEAAKKRSSQIDHWSELKDNDE